MQSTRKLYVHIGKWQLVLIALALIYGCLLVANLGTVPLQWDELNHFNGALLLLHGQISTYIGYNSYYPPLYNLVTTAFFLVGGASVLVGRLVTVMFSVVSMVLVYKIAKEMYSTPVALIAALLFAVMPGIVWLSSLAMIETMLLFALLFSLLLFFRWLQTDRQRDLNLSVAVLIVGVAVKYQILVIAPVIMAVSLLLLHMKVNLTPLRDFFHSKRIVLGVLLAGILTVLLYAFYASGLLSVWLYAIQVGNESQTVYSTRFFTPIFYFVEMVWPYPDQHPISPLLYVLGLAGLGLLACRRKPQDKFLLVWFFVVFVVFTLIPNRQWRYVTLLFPVLAISAAELFYFGYGKAQRVWQSAKTDLTRWRLAKTVAVALVAVMLVGVAFSCADAYNWAGKSQTQVPIQDAADYVSANSDGTHSTIVLCACNLFNRDMVWFYLNRDGVSEIPVYQYPKLAADAFKPDFTLDDLSGYCTVNGTVYVLLYEYGDMQYYDSSLTGLALYETLENNRQFDLSTTFGTAPNRIFVFSFNSTVN
jgi:4-amino-4-deoxy-L-arabinose transferase-like glycosyltransferase